MANVDMNMTDHEKSWPRRRDDNKRGCPPKCALGPCDWPHPAATVATIGNSLTYFRMESRTFHIRLVGRGCSIHAQSPKEDAFGD